MTWRRRQALRSIARFAGLPHYETARQVIRESFTPNDDAKRIRKAYRNYIAEIASSSAYVGS